MSVLCVPLNSLYFVALSTHHMPSVSRFGDVDWTQGAGQHFRRLDRAKHVDKAGKENRPSREAKDIIVVGGSAAGLYTAKRVAAGGHSVEVLMRVYAKCMTGLEDVWITRMNQALHLGDQPTLGKTEPTD